MTKKYYTALGISERPISEKRHEQMKSTQNAASCLTQRLLPWSRKKPELKIIVPGNHEDVRAAKTGNCKKSRNMPRVGEYDSTLRISNERKFAA
jgi:hypothetical protein